MRVRENSAYHSYFSLPGSQLFIPRHTIMAGYYGFTLVVTVSLCLSSIPTKIGMSIDIVEIWFEIANGHISSIFALNMSEFKFLDDNE